MRLIVRRLNFIVWSVILLFSGTPVYAGTIGNVTDYAKRVCNELGKKGPIESSRIKAIINSEISEMSQLLAVNMDMAGNEGWSDITDMSFNKLPKKLIHPGTCTTGVTQVLLDNMNQHSLQQGINKKNRTRSYTFSIENDFCDDDRELKLRVDAGEGWHIDISSIEPVVKTLGKSQFNGIVEKSTTGFTITGLVKNHGSCAKVFGQRAFSEGRGQIKGIISFREFRDITVSQN